MANKLIENKTHLYYTVIINDSIAVSSHEYNHANGKIDGVKICRDAIGKEVFHQEERAKKVARYVEGKVIKHTRTTVITELTEELTEEIIEQE